jgi:hypothetical protein
MLSPKATLARRLARLCSAWRRWLVIFFVPLVVFGLVLLLFRALDCELLRTRANGLNRALGASHFGFLGTVLAGSESTKEVLSCENGPQ